MTNEKTIPFYDALKDMVENKRVWESPKSIYYHHIYRWKDGHGLQFSRPDKVNFMVSGLTLLDLEGKNLIPTDRDWETGQLPDKREIKRKELIEDLKAVFKGEINYYNYERAINYAIKILEEELK